MSRVRVAGAAIACLVILGGASAQECRLAPPVIVVDTPEVGVDAQDVRTVIDYTAFPWQAQNQLAPGWSINGLTVARPRTTFRIESLSSPGCYAVSRIVLTFAYDDPVKVYVADKYVPGSCQHNIITMHEMQHVDIFKRGRMIYAGRLREMVADALRRSDGLNEARANGMISEAVDTVMHEFSAALGAAHGAIDTIENYRATQARCPVW